MIAITNLPNTEELAERLNNFACHHLENDFGLIKGEIKLQSFTTLSCSALNSGFDANVAIFYLNQNLEWD